MGLDIKVVGVGGRGNNSIYNMVAADLQGIDYIAVDTHPGDLQSCPADVCLHIDKCSGEGLFFSEYPELVSKYSGVNIDNIRENRARINEAIEGADLLFISAGLGGNTGTIAAPVIADLADRAGILTVGIVTLPFEEEGKYRYRNADLGLQMLRYNVDLLFAASNQRMFELVGESRSSHQVLKNVEEILTSGVKAIAELLNGNSSDKNEINDLKRIIRSGQQGSIGSGEAGGENAWLEATHRALECPLFESHSIENATGVIAHFESGPDYSKQDMNRALELVKESIPETVNLISARSICPKKQTAVRTTVLGTFYS